jgi:lipoprotein-releasing system permease protein
MKVAFKIAVRFLKSNIAQTSLIIVGIAVGVSVQIFIGSLIGGLQNGLIDKTIGNSSQITVKVDQGTFTNYKEIVDKIKEENVKYVVPVFDNNAILQVGSKSSSLLIRGLSINEADKIYDIKKSIKEGVVPTNDNELDFEPTCKIALLSKTGTTYFTFSSFILSTISL